jgi:hypothetical protein
MLLFVQSAKIDDFKYGSYLGLAVGAAIVLYLLSRKYLKRK